MLANVCLIKHDSNQYMTVIHACFMCHRFLCLVAYVCVRWLVCFPLSVRVYRIYNAMYSLGREWAAGGREESGWSMILIFECVCLLFIKYDDYSYFIVYYVMCKYIEFDSQICARLQFYRCTHAHTLYTINCFAFNLNAVAVVRHKCTNFQYCIVDMLCCFLFHVCFFHLIDRATASIHKNWCIH